MDLRRLLAIVRAWLLFLAMCVVVAAGLAFFLSSSLPKVYEAKATLIVGQSLSGVSPDYNQILVSQRLSATYATVATTRPNLQAVIDKLGLSQTADDLAASVTADAPLDSTLVTISAQDTDPKQAAAIANAVATQLIAVSPAIEGRQTDIQQSIDENLRTTQDQIDSTQTELESLTALTDRTAAQQTRLETLESRLVSLRSTYAALLAYSSGNASNLLTLIEPAEVPKAPISPRVLLNVLLGGLLGLLFGGAVTLVKDRLDDTIKTPEDAETSVGLPALGVIRKMSGERGRNEIYRLVALLQPRSSATESYRTLRANIEFAAVDDPIKTLLVTSSVPGEGKSVTAANLAIVFAQTGRRVLLMDADLRRPGLQRLFDRPNTHGLTTLLRGEDDHHAFAQATEQENLWILTTGPLPPNPAELLGSRRMGAIMDGLKSGYDLIILDSPPIQSVADAAILSSFMDATVLVIGGGKGHRATVQMGRESLERAGARVIGVVLNLIRDPARVADGGYYPSYAEVVDAAADAATTPPELRDSRPSSTP